MFKKFVSSLAAISLLTSCITPSLASEISGADGTYFFRYKSGFVAVDEAGQQGKDVVAYFVGGVGFDFSETLPLKPEWEDDNWAVTSGTVPEGLTFNPATRTFEGKPVGASHAAVVYLAGTDLNGNRVAEAKVTFDIYEIDGIPRKVDLYAHTGKYKVDDLTMPAGVAVDSWRYLYKSPSGITVNGPFFEGTPTAAGIYPVLIQGQNYMGETVVTFYGKYTVEDHPSWPHIADSISKLPQIDYNGLPLGPYNFGAPFTSRINRAIDPAKAVRYFLEVDTAKSDGLPGSIVSNDFAKDLRLTGFVWQPYDTATVRYRALDSDGTEGYSNWFTFGSSDPQPGCAPYSQLWPLTVYTGRPANINVPRPVGSQGRLEFSVKSGTFPSGLSLDRDSGAIVGTPLVAGQVQNMDFQVDVINGSNSVSTSCGYQISVVAGSKGISDATDAQARHIRTGDVYTGRANISGGIPQYDVSFVDPTALPVGFTTPTKNATSIGVSGVIPTAGAKSIGLTFANGDGSTMTGALTAVAHDELSVGNVATVHIKRLAAPAVWVAIPYDAATVIPDVKLGNMPAFSISNASGLPSGIGFDGDGQFVGTTKAQAKSYGTYSATMSDFSGDKVTTQPFEVVVDPRDEIAAKGLVPPVFTVEWDGLQQKTVFTVQQPYVAQAFKIAWALNPVGNATVPAWLSIDPENGFVQVRSGVPYSEIGSYGPFTITATDEEGSSVTSDQFNLTMKDRAPPEGTVGTKFEGSVSGDTSIGETATFMSIPSLLQYVNPDSVIGGRAGVTFISSDPKNPAGLDFDVTEGSFSGVPTSESTVKSR
jgi:hypothetical protein